MADALSIEQNNKIRVALGLKPLPVPGAGPRDDGSSDSDSDSNDEENDPGSTLESRAAEGYDNWKKRQDEEDARKKRQARHDAIRKAREAAQRMAKLEGKGLGEAEGPDAVDTKSWLMQHKKLQKKIEKERARKLEEELAEREELAAREYTAKDLAGVKVGHELADFDEEGGEQILTLKDATIDQNEDEGDELENAAMREVEKTRERMDTKKKMAGYNPMEDGEGAILAQYDEEIDGKKRKHFTLDSRPMTAEEREAKRQDVSSKLKMQKVSLDDIVIPDTTSDYVQPSEIKIKKPKKKKAKTTRRKAADDDDIPTVESTTETPTADQSNGNSMDIDGDSRATSAAPKKRSSEDMFFADDEDLRASLALQRRAAFKKRKKMGPEELARQMREESEQAANGMDVDRPEDEEPGLVIDETSEFVANLQRPTIPERRPRSVSHAPEEPTAKSPSDEQEPEPEDVDMDRSYNDIEDEEELMERIKKEETKPPTNQISGTGLQEEGTLDHGIGGTLAMLKQRGLVEETNAADRNSLLRQRQHFLIEKQRREADAEARARQQRERDRSSGKFERMSARDREEYARWENKQRDQQDSRQMADVFNREYKPDVQLKYVDEHGRMMGSKEAFKHLSHQFHGKGSGKMKTEKHLKKIEDEKKREAMSTLDSSQNTGMNKSLGAAARRNRQAGVRLA